MKVICYGDSNTYGYDGRSFIPERLDNPWPEILQTSTGWNVANQGENGREIPTKAVSFPEDSDLLIIMLGTNELLQLWSPEAAAEKMRSFLESIRLPRDRILLIAPPEMKPGDWVQDPELIGDCHTLASEYEALSRELGIRFANAGQWKLPISFDGVHMTQEGHQHFANELLRYLNKAQISQNIKKATGG